MFPSFRRLAFVFLGVLILAGAVGCTDSNKAFQFNQRIVGIESKLEPSINQFTASIEGFGEGRVDEQGVRTEFQKVITKLESSIKEAEAVSVPDVALAPEMHSSMVSYFKENLALWNTEMKQLVDTLLDQSISDLERAQRLSTIEAQIQTKTNKMVADIQRIQQRFASKHRFRVE